MYQTQASYLTEKDASEEENGKDYKVEKDKHEEEINQ